jgi:hypothetical protein
MKIFDELEKKQKQIERVFGPLENVRPFIILKNLIDEIEFLLKTFSKKESLKFINTTLGVNIKYRAFIKFINSYLKVEQSAKSEIKIDNMSNFSSNNKINNHHTENSVFDHLKPKK